jgi:tyrosyl-tRNA synthetase
MKDVFVNELQWRGMIHDMSAGTEERLRRGMVVGYAGFDPTAPSLQIGNLAALMLLVHLQRAGHKPLALVGGATGLIGDPSGKDEERVLMSVEQVRHNAECIAQQLRRFLDFGCGAASADVVNNYDWLFDVRLLDFLRETGKHLTVGYMLAKDSVQQRLKGGLSFTEFSYQLMQAYDFYWLYTNRVCELQVGGSDQWGNITAGAELIRRKAGAEAYALTCPLVTKADGTKFGKSEGGEKIWLDASMTSAYRFYQFWLNATDDDAVTLTKVFTLLGQDEVKALEKAQAGAPHERALQKALATEVTTRVHGRQACDAAVRASEILFGKGTAEALRGLSEEELLAMLEGVPRATVSASEFERGILLLDLLCGGAGICASKGEARRLLAGGGVSINKAKASQPDMVLKREHLLNGKYLLVQKGKKNYHVVIAA